MNSDLSKIIFSIILSTLFTIALFYATFILPITISSILRRIFPDIYQWHEIPENISYLYQCAMLIGLSTFIISIIFIVLGFIVRRTKISLIGALTLYLPVFSGFAYSMFLFAGIGVLRFIWYPLVQIMGGFAGILSTGFTVLSIPILIIISPFVILDFLGVTQMASIIAYQVVAMLLILIGLVILGVSIATWLYYRLKGAIIIRRGIYKYIRHPQYLGFLIWSYSLIFIYSFIRASPFAYYPPPGLPYLIILFTIIGIALIEEKKLIEKYGDEYRDYREKASFIIPLPKKIKDLILWIPRKIIHKDIPETRLEVVKVLVIYFIIVISISLPFDIILFSH